MNGNATCCRPLHTRKREAGDLRDGPGCLQACAYTAEDGSESHDPLLSCSAAKPVEVAISGCHVISGLPKGCLLMSHCMTSVLTLARSRQAAGMPHKRQKYFRRHARCFCIESRANAPGVGRVRRSRPDQRAAPGGMSGSEVPWRLVRGVLKSKVLYRYSMLDLIGDLGTGRRYPARVVTAYTQ